MQESIPIIKFVSPEQPIRLALGKLGFANMMQTISDDMVAWVMEAQDLIQKDRRVLKSHTRTEKVYDNQIPHCAGNIAIDCVKKGGVPLTYQVDGSCKDTVTKSCCTVCCDNAANGGQKFIVNSCYTQFSPALPDGTEIEITSLNRPEAESGYPMIADVCVTAITEYVKWMICFRERDNRTAACEQRWYALCRIARANLRKGEWSQKNIEQLGYYWW